MARICPTCSTNWKSIVNFCPSCRTDLNIQAENEGSALPVKFQYENQNSIAFKGPALWIFIGLLAAGAAFAVVKSGSNNSIQSTSQVVQGENNVTLDDTGEIQQDPSPTESGNAEMDVVEQPANSTSQDPNSGPINPSKTFNEPKPKAILTLDAWLRKYSIDNALISIQKWSATYKSINPTQLDEAQNELGDAVTALENASRHLESQGSSRISTYDQQQLALGREIQKYLDSAGSIWIRINNQDFGSRQEIVDFLAENIGLLEKVNIKVNSLLEWVRTNGSKYEVR